MKTPVDTQVFSFLMKAIYSQVNMIYPQLLENFVLK